MPDSELLGGAVGASWCSNWSSMRHKAAHKYAIAKKRERGEWGREWEALRKNVCSQSKCAAIVDAALLEMPSRAQVKSTAAGNQSLTRG